MYFCSPTFYSPIKTTCRSFFLLNLCYCPQLWTPLNVILFNLVCSDFSVSVLGNPFTLVSALFHRWVFGHTMCVLYGFFMALLGEFMAYLYIMSYVICRSKRRPLWRSGHHSCPLSEGPGLDSQRDKRFVLVIINFCLVLGVLCPFLC